MSTTDCLTLDDIGAMMASDATMGGKRTFGLWECPRCGETVYFDDSTAAATARDHGCRSVLYDVVAIVGGRRSYVAFRYPTRAMCEETIAQLGSGEYVIECTNPDQSRIER